MDMMGSVLNERYEITGEIGAGAMGIVYRGSDHQTGGQVAIKVLPPALARDPQYLARFEREARALRDLNHPNIVPFIDSFQEDNYYLVMEYMPGGNLYDLLKREGALPIDEARQIAIDISDALIRAHRLDITHRDLKPENILFDAEGQPRLADFGVAGMSTSEEGTRLTGTGMQMGTPYYMSPEAWQGERLGAQSDIWSLGIVLYEMLTGELPFGGGYSHHCDARSPAKTDPGYTSGAARHPDWPLRDYPQSPRQGCVAALRQRARLQRRSGTWRACHPLERLWRSKRKPPAGRFARRRDRRAAGDRRGGGWFAGVRRRR